MRAKNKSNTTLLKIKATFEQLKYTLKIIFGKRSFTFHWISFATIFGSFNAFYVIMNQILKPSLKSELTDQQRSEDWIIALAGFTMVSRM